MAHVGVIGTGAWGTTLARMIALEQIRLAEQHTNGHPVEDVTLWDHYAPRARAMQWERVNTNYLPGFPLPANIRVTSDLAEAVAGRDVIVIVTPSQRLRDNARELARFLEPGTLVVSGSKGLELGTHLRMTQILREVLAPDTPVAALSGPNLAMEIARGLPAAAVIASSDTQAAQRGQVALSTSLFRLYTSDDVIGVELGGALKNIIALGVGVSDGLSYGDNAKASFMTRALAEISRLALAAGANPLTLAGLAGLGDLIATCMSALSRNRTLGLELAKGRALQDVLAERKTVAEGVSTTRAALELAGALDVELPITAEIARVLFEGKSVREAVQSLMIRDQKHELAGL